MTGRLIALGGPLLRAVATAPALLATRLPRPVRWLISDPHRLLTLAWLVGLLLVGQARPALADGIIVGPDLAGGQPRTLFETYEFTDYKLTVRPDDEASGWFDIGAGLLQVIGFINNLLLWLCLGVLYGALTLLEWFLHLTIYQDSAGQIDLATQAIATEVFWPLISTTTAVGAVIAYTRWRGEGRGFLSDLGWVIAAAGFGMVIATNPSGVIGAVDGLRQDLGAGISTGAAQYASTAGNPAGFPQPEIGGDLRTAGTRRLADSMWNTFGVTTWCYAQFRDLDVCRATGHHALAEDEQWRQWMQVLDDNGVVPEFGDHGHWVRGQDMTRTGYLLVLALISLPAGVVLLRLVIAGLTAAVGVLLLVIVWLVFLAFWAIPGWFRELGIRYTMFTLGCELQALIITAAVAGLTVASTIVAGLVGQYGFFVVAVLNLALLSAAMRARSWLEVLTTGSGAGSMGLAGYLVARSALQTARSAVVAATGLPWAATRAAGAFANDRAHGPGWGRQPGGWARPWGTRSGTVPRTRLAGLSTEPIRATAARMTSRWPAIERGPVAAIGPGWSPATGTGAGQPTKGNRRSRGGRASAAEPHRNRPNRAAPAATRRVWVAHPRSGISPLEVTTSPSPSRRSWRSRRTGGTTEQRDGS